MTVTKEKLEVREYKTDREFDRVAELWANMAMVQQMQGKDLWIKKHQESKKDWLSYIHSFRENKNFKFVVFEDPKKIFGFAFLEIKKESKKTIVKINEIYMEPSHQNLSDTEISEMLIKCLKAMGIDQVDLR